MQATPSQLEQYCFIFTESQAGRDLWAHLAQPLPKQGHPEQAAQGHVQMAFGDLQGGNPTACLGSMCPGSLTRTAQKCCLKFRQPPVFQFVPILLCIHLVLYLD